MEDVKIMYKEGWWGCGGCMGMIVCRVRCGGTVCDRWRLVYEGI